MKTKISRSNLLLIALTWGMGTGLGEGIVAKFRHPAIWKEILQAAVLVDALIFVLIGIGVIVAINSRQIERSVSVRLLICLSFFGFYATLGEFASKWFRFLPFVLSLVLSGFLGVLTYYRTDLVVNWHRKGVLALFVIFVYCGIAFPLQRQRTENRELASLRRSSEPGLNVVLVVVDTLRADHLSSYRYQRDTSPGLARLAAAGTVFEDAIAASSWTLPSHASMVTGLYPTAHHADGDDANLGSGFPTIAEALSRNGYRTAAFSANTGTFSRDRGFGRGFLHFEDAFQNWGSSLGETFYGEKIESWLCHLHILRDLLGRLTASQINQHALRWIDVNSKPFFVLLNYYDAHDPYLPPDPYLHAYTTVPNPGGRFTLHWEWFEDLTPQQRQAALDAYDGAIKYIDAQITDLVSALEHRQLTRNTVIIITSDHGEGFNEHGLMNHGNSLYRELIHVPLILWCPGQIPAGVRINTPVSLTALPATLLDLAGLPNEFPGHSLSGLWQSGIGPAAEPPAPISEIAQLPWNRRYPNYYGAMQSVTTSRWHYIKGGNTGEQLYSCCDDGISTSNMAQTAEGKKLCQAFRDKLRLELSDGRPSDKISSSASGRVDVGYAAR